MVNHMKDSADDAAEEIRREIRKGTKQGFRELARLQKQELPRAAGAEEQKYLTGWDDLRTKENLHGIMGKSYDAIHHSISLQNKKKVYFQTHIWGL